MDLTQETNNSPSVRAQEIFGQRAQEMNLSVKKENSLDKYNEWDFSSKMSLMSDEKVLNAITEKIWHENVEQHVPKNIVFAPKWHI
ncbi:hypothetical protein KKG31_06095 [Patescibacteria group bacterium]|nr:hypothetical protein [Patescibacteria group bacterium]